MFIRSAQSAIQICSVDNSIQRGTGEELVRRGQISDQLYSLFTSVWTWPKVIPTRSKFNLIEIKIQFSVVLGKGQTERVKAQFTGDLSKGLFDRAKVQVRSNQRTSSHISIQRGPAPVLLFPPERTAAVSTAAPIHSMECSECFPFAPHSLGSDKLELATSLFFISIWT